MANPRGDKYSSLANFKDVMLIGKGQFSTVYRARCAGDNSVVALKKIQVNPCYLKGIVG